MKPLLVATLLGLAGTVVLAGALAAAEPKSPGERTWTSRQGRTVDAAFVRVRGERVYLRRATGKTLAISLGDLSEADQEFVREMSAPGPVESTAVSSRARSMSQKRPGEVLTEGDIGELKTGWTGEDGHHKLVFSSGFSIPSLDDQTKRKYRNSGRVPFRITAALYEHKGGRRKRVEKGKGRLYLLDSDNRIVLSKSVSMDAMCPT